VRLISLKSNALLVALASLTLTAVIAAAAGCGSDRALGRLDGSVTLGPLTPVEQVGGPPSEKPYQATIDVRVTGGKRMATVSSGKDGRFSLSLPAGRYTLVPRTPTDSPLPYASPVDVVVVAGRVTTVTIAYDTGIRGAQSSAPTTP
jgi:hypothetical protein